MCGVAMEVPEMLLVALNADEYHRVSNGTKGLTVVLPIQEEMTFWPGAQMSTTEP